MNARSIYLWVLFVIWPLGAMLANFIRAQKWRKVHTQVSLAFCVYLGFNFVVGGESGKSDSYRYAQELVEFKAENFTLGQFGQLLYNSETGEVDVYQPLLTFIVAQLTDDPRYLFALFALVFGYLWIGNFRMVYDSLNLKWSWLVVLMIVGYLLVNPIWHINGVRMWTATHLFVYGVSLVILKKKKSGVLLSLLSPLIHWSFLLPIFVILLYYLVRNFGINLFLVFFLLSVFFAEIDLEQVRVYQNYLPEVFSERASKYTNEGYVERSAVNVDKSWHYELAVLIKKWFGILMPIVICLDKRILTLFNVRWVHFFKFGLLVGSVGYLSSQIPSGSRFILVASMFLFPVIINYVIYLLEYRVKYYRLLSIVVSMPIIFWYIVMIRIGLGSIGLNVLIGNPFTSLISSDSVPLMSFVKKVF